MTFADDSTRQTTGVIDVQEAVQPRSEWARRLAMSPVCFGPHDAVRWEQEQLQLREVDSWWRAEVVTTCSSAFEQLPTLERPLRALEASSVLDEVALFELKRFFYYAAQVATAAAAPISAVEPWWGDRLAELMTLIHPERHASPRFILAAQLDERLAGARQVLKSARRAERARRREFEAAIVQELGGKFDIGGRYVPDPSVALADPRLRPLGGGKYEVVDPDIETLAEAVAAAQDGCWDIEVDVRARLSDALREEIELLVEIREVLGELDVRCALVELRRSWNGCWPEWSDTQTIIEAGRHPRLLDALPAHEVQSVSIALDARPAIVTGPNMGGKSLLLELIGLCQWCAQHGYPAPASRFVFVPVERIVYVGSESLIAGRSGLSSFGYEVRRVVEQCADGARCLWLLDEFARGTHPDEGATIARDFIAARVRASDRVVAATHFPELARMEAASHFRIAGLSSPDALRALENDLSLADIEAALRAVMDYAPLPRDVGDVAVPRDARLVARALGLDLDFEE